MSAVTPVVANGCKGTYASGAANIKLKCVRSFDDEGVPTFNCATMRLFKVSCSKLNQQCSGLSNAYVAAITVCAQKLF